MGCLSSCVEWLILIVVGVVFVASGILNGCAVLLNPNVETVVGSSAGGMVMSPQLSSDGTVLTYYISKQGSSYYNLATGERGLLPRDCEETWLNETLMFCGKTLMMDMESVTDIPLKVVDAQKEEIVPLLEQANATYEVEYQEGYSRKQAFVLLNSDPAQHTFITNLPEGFKWPSQLPQPLAPGNGKPSAREKTTSPDGLYYYNDEGIYAVEDNRLLVDMPGGFQAYAHVIGWLHDSSGILYQMYDGNGTFDVRPRPVYKLKVPQKWGWFGL